MKSMFHPCPAMTKMLDNSREIELPCLISFTGKDAGIDRHGYVGWKGNKKNGIKGIAFNVCPYCGEKILNGRKELCTDKIPYYEGEEVVK
jgi:ribosomal protein L32